MAAPKKSPVKKPAPKKTPPKKAAPKKPVGNRASSAKSAPQALPSGAGSKTRNRVIGLAVVLMVAALGYSLLWQAVARRLTANIEQSFIQLADQGTKITHDGLSVSGFPYRLVVTLREPVLKTRSGNIELASDQITAFSHLWTPSHWVFDAATTRLETGVLPALSFPALKASWRQLGNTGQRIVVEGARGQAASVPVHNLIIGLALPSEEARAADDDLLGETLAIATLGLTTAGERLDLKARITGTGLDDLSQQSLSAWSNSGGVVEVSTLGFNLGPGRQLKGSASLSLDQDFFALGTLDLTPVDQAAEVPTLLKPLLPGLGAIDRAISISLQNGSFFVDGSYVGDTKPLFK